MIQQFISTFRKPSATLLAQRELEDAKRELLLAQSAAEYSSRLSAYHIDRIKRLTTYLRDDAAVPKNVWTPSPVDLRI